MMSVVVADSDGTLFVFSKGAETAILPLVSEQDSASFKDTSQHIEEFAEQGMRTLVFAYKQIGTLADIADQADSYFESDLVLLGATGVEDMLQENVKKCITDF